MKKYIICIIALFIVMLSNIISYGANEQVEAILSHEISIVFNNELKQFSDVNGTKVYPILYQGTTYLPIRAISALFDTAVEWDGSNNSIYLGKGELSSNTVKTITSFTSGNNETVSTLLNKDIKIEYKEKVQTFKDVNGNVVYPLSYNNTTYLPVRAISTMYGATINWNGDNHRITIERENNLASITNVTIKVIDGIICAAITTDNPLYDYKYYSLTEPDRVVIDLKNSSFDIDKSNLQIDYKELKQVRFGDQGNNLSRIVLDVDKIGTYTVFQSNDRKLTYLALSEELTEIPSTEKDKNSVLVASIGDRIYLPEDDNNDEEDNTYDANNNDTNNNETNNNETNNNETNNNPSSGENNISDEQTWGGDDENTDDNSKNDDNSNSKLTDEEIAKLAKVTSVVYSPSTNMTKISITGNYTYEKFMLDDPQRLVIDISGAILQVDSLTQITPKNKIIKQIRFSQNEETKVRVVFELNSNAEYEISKKNKTLEVTIIEPEYKNIEYEAFDDYATLTLLNVKKSVFDATENSKTYKYTISYSSSKFNSGKSTLDINDDFVKNIDIKTNKIVISAEKNMRFKMAQDGDNVVITISNNSSSNKKESDDDFVVLIDAGHGGTDPGACNTNNPNDPTNQEKMYNLKIALMLYDMLKETDGVRVYISRDDDTYIGQQGRLDFATSRDDTDLYVSIHNNSAANKNYNGTMVLYYDKEYDKDYGITSKEFASIVLEELVSALGTKNLGVVSRNDLWVLYYSEVPSILCEVSFVSNDAELERLKTEEFQRKAAQAIYDGIFVAKEQMER